MKRMVYVFLLLMFALKGIGQVWIDTGAVWHYDYWTIGSGGFLKMEYEKDTMIQGRTCQKIITHDYTFGMDQWGKIFLLGKFRWPDEFTTVSGDTVFYWRNNEFYVLYNFGASIGDHWIVSVVNPGGMTDGCDDTSRVLVTDTCHVMIGGKSYRTITLEPFPNAAVGLMGTYVERFGLISTDYWNFQYMFPMGYQCDSMAHIVEWYFLRFKCFQDRSFPLYKPLPEGCEHLLTIGMDEPDKQSFSVYPNPTIGAVYISDPMNRDKTVEVFNYQGAMAKSVRLSGNKNIVNLSELPPGVYLVVIKSEHAEVQTFKIVKE
jgi:hypothetical protein